MLREHKKEIPLKQESNEEAKEHMKTVSFLVISLDWRYLINNAVFHNLPLEVSLGFLQKGQNLSEVVTGFGQKHNVFLDLTEKSKENLELLLLKSEDDYSRMYIDSDSFSEDGIMETLAENDKMLCSFDKATEYLAHYKQINVIVPDLVIENNFNSHQVMREKINVLHKHQDHVLVVVKVSTIGHLAKFVNREQNFKWANITDLVK
ncbi:MAG: hypothetical protein HRK26_00830 [Rickettsiaceae bacterium H1]|nr:hypothetical protein [Rickettsiaceae bacterium H1]